MPWVYHDTYGTFVASSKFDLTAEEICQANTFQFRIDNDIDFGQALVTLASKAQDKQHLLRMLEERKRTRVADLDSLLSAAAVTLAHHPSFMKESTQWWSAMCLFREQCLSRLIQFTQSFIPEAYTLKQLKAEERLAEIKKQTRKRFPQHRSPPSKPYLKNPVDTLRESRKRKGSTLKEILFGDVEENKKRQKDLGEPQASSATDANRSEKVTLEQSHKRKNSTPSRILFEDERGSKKRRVDQEQSGTPSAADSKLSEMNEVECCLDQEREQAVPSSDLPFSAQAETTERDWLPSEISEAVPEYWDEVPLIPKPKEAPVGTKEKLDYDSDSKTSLAAIEEDKPILKGSLNEIQRRICGSFDWRRTISTESGAMEPLAMTVPGIG